MRKTILIFAFSTTIFFTVQAQTPSTLTLEKNDNTSTSLNLKNPIGFWHLSGPRSYETNNNFSVFWNDGTYKRYFTILDNGNVGIGTLNPDTKLTVKGNIHAQEVKIDLSVPAPDYVFRNDYNLKSLEEVEKFIDKNNHLPEIPSAKEFEQNGILQAEMDMNLLKKIEELTLYTIQQQKEIEELKSLVKELIETKK